MSRHFTRPTNDKALDAFVAKISEAAVLARKVVAALDNHLDLDPDDIHWGHVGDAERILEVLREAHRVACHSAYITVEFFDTLSKRPVYTISVEVPGSGEDEESRCEALRRAHAVGKVQGYALADKHITHRFLKA